MGLRFDPVGGGQFKQAVKQIIEAESQPVRTLEARKAKESARLKLFQEFKTKFQDLDKTINEMSTFRKFRDLKVDLGDGNEIASVTIDKDRAEPGQYDVEIIQLATRTSVMTNGFESPTEPILGPGYLTFNTQDGDPVEIEVEEEESSLRGIAALINRNPRSPVRAAVISDDSEYNEPWKLVITAKREGEINQVDFPEFFFVDSGYDLYVDDDREAENASVAVDGFAFESTLNTIEEFLPGVNLHLKQARPDKPFTLTISEDHQKITGRVKGLVDQLNQILQFIVKQNSIDESSDTTTTFAGDTGLQTLEYQLRNLIHNPYPGSDGLEPGDEGFKWVNLTQIGIEFEKTGTLAFKEEKFKKAIEGNFDSIATAITGPSGFIGTIRRLFDSYTRSSNGLLTAKEQGLRSRVRQIDDQIDQKNRLLEQRKQDLTDKFARLEATVGAMQRQQQYLGSVLGGGGNPISQLLG